MYVVVMGNLVDGFLIYGPFTESGAAVEWGDANADGGDWGIVPVKLPFNLPPEN